MTAPVALLVTGSRSLAKQTDEEARRNITPASEKWARAILAEAIGALPPGSLLIHGGATGPDSWAQEAIEARRSEDDLRRRDSYVALRSAVYETNGRRRWMHMGGGTVEWSVAHWHPGDPGPLARNKHMVSEVMPALVASGYKPSVLALVDSTSRTKGADHTVGLARKAGYPVDRRVWPDPSPR